MIKRIMRNMLAPAMALFIHCSYFRSSDEVSKDGGKATIGLDNHPPFRVYTIEVLTDMSMD